MFYCLHSSPSSLCSSTSVDPYQEVSTNAQTIVDYITALLLESPFKHLDSASLGYSPAVPLSRRGSP